MFSSGRSPAESASLQSLWKDAIFAIIKSDLAVFSRSFFVTHKTFEPLFLGACLSENFRRSISKLKLWSQHFLAWVLSSRRKNGAALCKQPAKQTSSMCSKCLFKPVLCILKIPSGYMSEGLAESGEPSPPCVRNFFWSPKFECRLVYPVVCKVHGILLSWSPHFPVLRQSMTGDWSSRKSKSVNSIKNLAATATLGFRLLPGEVKKSA